MKLINQKGSFAIVLGVIIAIVIISGGAYVYYLTQQKASYYRSLQQEAIQKKEQYDRENAKALSPSPSDNSLREEDWKSYSNNQYKFSIKYPPSWQYKENDPPTPHLNKYHMTFFSSDRNSVLDLAVMDGNYDEAKKGLSATKKLVNETNNGIVGFSILDDKGNKSLSYFSSPFSSNETFVLTYLTKTDYSTLEEIKNTLQFLK